MTRLNPRTGDPLQLVEPDLDAWEPDHRPSLRRGLAILATVLVIGLALGFAAGRASASDGLRDPVTHIAAPAPGSALRGPEGQIRPITPVLPPALEESVGGTLELPAAASSDEGYATWCAPTPTHCQGWGGNVLVGAVRSFSYGDRPYAVTVWRGSRHVSVRVISHCACGNRAGRPTLIDLSPAAFTRLAPLAAGVIEVRVVGGGTVERPLPATDTGP